jgi:hypothetical protein
MPDPLGDLKCGAHWEVVTFEKITIQSKVLPIKCKRLATVEGKKF